MSLSFFSPKQNKQKRKCPLCFDRVKDCPCQKIRRGSQYENIGLIKRSSPRPINARLPLIDKPVDFGNKIAYSELELYSRRKNLTREQAVAQMQARVQAQSKPNIALQQQAQQRREQDARIRAQRSARKTPVKKPSPVKSKVDQKEDARLNQLAKEKRESQARARLEATKKPMKMSRGTVKLMKTQKKEQDLARSKLVDPKQKQLVELIKERQEKTGIINPNDQPIIDSIESGKVKGGFDTKEELQTLESFGGTTFKGTSGQGYNLGPDLRGDFESLFPKQTAQLIKIGQDLTYFGQKVTQIDDTLSRHQAKFKFYDEKIPYFDQKINSEFPDIHDKLNKLGGSVSDASKGAGIGQLLGGISLPLIIIGGVVLIMVLRK